MERDTRFELATYLNIIRRFNPNLHLLSFRAENGYLDIVISDSGFVLTSGEYEHPVYGLLLVCK